jgi:hypothetical protein
VLRDELEGIDFYIAQGYIEIAQDTLGRLRAEYGSHPEILARFKRLGAGGAAEGALADAPSPVGNASAGVASEGENAYANSAFEDYLKPPSSESFDIAQGFAFSPYGQPGDAAAGGNLAAEIDLSMFISGDAPLTVDAPPARPPVFKGPDEAAKDNGASAFHADVSYTGSLVGNRLGGDVALNTFAPPEEEKESPFLIQKDTGPLQADLIVKFNTSDLLHNTMFDPAQRAGLGAVPPTGTEELIESLVSNIDASFDHIRQIEDGAAEAHEPSRAMPAEPEMSEISDERPPESARVLSDGESGFAISDPNAGLSFDPADALSPEAESLPTSAGAAGEAENTASWSADLFSEPVTKSDLDDIL